MPALGGLEKTGVYDTAGGYGPGTDRTVPGTAGIGTVAVGTSVDLHDPVGFPRVEDRFHPLVPFEN